MSHRHVKVLVLGPAEAGKSTLIQALCEDAINLHVRGRTVALDYGTREYKDVIFHFFGVPGQERFASVQESLMTGSHVAIVVVPQGIPLDPLTRHWCNLLVKRGIPLIRVWNRFGSSRTREDSDPDRHLFAHSVELDLEHPLEPNIFLSLLYSIRIRLKSP